MFSFKIYKQSLVEQCPSEDPDTEVNLGCLLFKEGHFQQACQKFQSAMQILGYRPGDIRFIMFATVN